MASHTAFAAFRDWLLEPGHEPRVAILGMGGVGKSALALALARDQAVHRRFADGVLWAVAADQDATALALHSSLSSSLGGPGTVSSVQRGHEQLSALLGDRDCLIVLDGVVADADTLRLDAGLACNDEFVGPEPQLVDADHRAAELGRLDVEPGCHMLVVPKDPAPLAPDTSSPSPGIRC